jgi:hypothetical protein
VTSNYEPKSEKFKLRVEFHVESDDHPDSNCEYLYARFDANLEPTAEEIQNCWEQFTESVKNKLSLRLDDEQKAEEVVNGLVDDEKIARAQRIDVWFANGVIKFRSYATYRNGYGLSIERFLERLRKSAENGDWNWNRKDNLWWARELVQTNW